MSEKKVLRAHATHARDLDVFSYKGRDTLFFVAAVQTAEPHTNDPHSSSGIMGRPLRVYTMYIRIYSIRNIYCVHMKATSAVHFYYIRFAGGLGEMKEMRLFHLRFLLRTIVGTRKKKSNGPFLCKHEVGIYLLSYILYIVDDYRRQLAHVCAIRTHPDEGSRM